jgi:YggT family protein
VVIVGQILSFALLIYFLLLIFRLIMDFVFQFARSYEPHGPMLVALEVTFTLTDPPLKLIRRFIPPLRIGGVAIDLAFLILIIVVQVLRAVVANTML